MAFYGAVVKPGKPTPCVPHSEGWNLHLSQASLPATESLKSRVSLLVNHRGEPATIIATLTAGQQDSVALDLFFSEYVEFSLQQGANVEVHLAGYFSPPHMDDDEDDGQMMGYDGEDEEMDSDDEDVPYGAMYGADMYGSDDDDDDDDDDEGEEGEDDEDEDEDDNLDPKRPRKPHVVIEEVKDDEPDTKSKPKLASKEDKSKALVPINKANGLPEMDIDEDEDDEDEDDEDEGEKEEQPVKGKQAEAAAAAAAGSKRPAEQKAAEGQQPNKKQATAPQAQQAKQTPAKAEAKQQQQQTPAKAHQQQQQQQKTPATADAKKQQQQDKKTPKQDAKQEQQKQDAKATTPAQQQTSTPQAKQAAGEVKSSKKNVRKWENGFEIEEMKLGPPNGKLAKAGKKVLVQYVGKLKSNGKVFDQTRGKPFQFRLGVGEVIKGWDLGVEGMRVGDKRRLVIPAQLGYGSSGVKGTIPPNATLEFDVELVDVK